jgi:hypothetical protein
MIAYRVGKVRGAHALRAADVIHKFSAAPKELEETCPA